MIEFYDRMIMATTSENPIPTDINHPLAQPFTLNGLTIHPKPQRFRTGRRNRANYEAGSADRAAETKVDEAINATLDLVEAGLSKRLCLAENETEEKAVAIKTGDTFRPKNFEYHEHPADIQLHAWGKNLAEALENVSLAMFNYMTTLATVNRDPKCDDTLTVSATDESQLVFNLLSELIVKSNTVALCNIRVVSLNEQKWTVTVQVEGEPYCSRHDRGTEVKAMTYSALKVEKEIDKVHIWCIVDI